MTILGENPTADRWLWFVDEELIAALSSDSPKGKERTPAEISPEPPPEPAKAVIAAPIKAPIEAPEALADDGIWERALAQANAGQYEQALESYRSFLKLTPKHAGAEYNAAVCLQELGRFNEAKQAFEAALTLNPKLPEASTGLAWCLLRLQRGDEALTLLERNLEPAPSDSSSLMGRAQALHLMGRFEEAKDAYLALLDHDSANPDVLANLIAVSAESRSAAGLRHYSESLLQVRARSRQALAGLVTANLLEQNYADAAVRAAEFLEAEPASYEGWFNAALAYEKVGRLDEAEQAYRKATELNPTHPSARLNLGALLVSRGEDSQAKAVLGELLQSDPDFPGALSNAALASERLGQWVEAEALLKRLVAGHPERIEALFRLGLARFNTQDWTGAVETFEQCLAKRLDWNEARVYLGLALWNAGDVEAGKVALDEALLQDPIYVPALQCRTALALAAHDLEAAHELEAQLADLGQTIPEFCFNVGALQYEAKQYEQAAASYRRAVASQPAFAEALLNLGHAVAALGLREEAVEHWRNALELQPELAAGYFRG